MSRRRSRDDDDDDAPTQSSGAGPFGWGFGITCGVIAAVALVVLGIPLLCLGILGYSSYRKVNEAAQKVQDVQHPDQVGNQPAPPAAGKPFLEMGDSTAFGEVRISLTGASYDFVPLKDFRGVGKSEDKLLMVGVRMQNGSATKKVNYHGWQPEFGFDDYASLKDDKGNSYKRITFGIDKVVGRAERGASVYPGKELTDILVFEEPVAGCQYLILTLPGGALDVDGKEAKFRIPRSAWEKK